MMKEEFQSTGTLAPLINQKEYTENEKIVLLHFFTNVDKNIYCAKDSLSSQLWAFLVGQYSRTPLSMRDRFLQLFEDAKNTYEKGLIENEEYITLDKLAEEIKNSKTLNLEFFNKKASDFLKKWGVDYGHNSLKDADKIRFAIEGVSQVFTKIIESPFPALGDFQEKSTRYMNFKKENLIISENLKNSKYAKEINEVNEELMNLYEESLPQIKDALIKNKIIKNEDFKNENAFNNTLDAKTFDIARYVLPSSIMTSLGASFSTRICESHISEMLSHPLEEVRLIAKSMHKEALKISPGLLSHVKENDYLINKKQKILNLTNEIFYKKPEEKIIKGIQKENRVTFINADNIDEIVLTSILFENGRVEGVSFSECLEKVKTLTQDTKEEIMEIELGSRGEFDRMPRSIQHGKILFEFLTDFGAYRDYQRHRASHQIWQGATAIHGYDYPEFTDLLELNIFKQKYDKLMTKTTLLARKISKENPFEAEYVSTLGHLVRSTFEMHPGQLAYVLELRTTPQGHQSYRKLFQYVYEILKEKAPLFSKYIRVNQDLESSRKKQEEK